MCKGMSENNENSAGLLLTLSEKQMEQLMEAAAKRGIEAYKEEHIKAEKERQDRNFNNAKTLIYNYRRFKGMCEESVYDLDTSSDYDLKEILELMSGRFRSSNYEVVSIKDKVVRTKMIMEHVDSMLAVFKSQCMKSVDPEDHRRYRIIDGLYLNPEPKKARELAEEENITISTVYRDAEKSFKRLAILFFGIDGVKF